jgi:hypothetical protein
MTVALQTDLAAAQRAGSGNWEQVERTERQRGREEAIRAQRVVLRMGVGIEGWGWQRVG